MLNLGPLEIIVLLLCLAFVVALVVAVVGGVMWMQRKR
jgi:uncharacterized iron-regulated membrane protein